MAVSSIYDNCVYTGINECSGTFEKITGRADRSGTSQPTEFIFGSDREVDRFLNVFDRDQSFQMAVVIDNQQLLDTMFLQLYFGFIECGANRNGNKRLRRHYLRDRNICSRFETEIAVRDNADEQTVCVGDGNAADLETAHDRQRVRDESVLFDRNGIDDHS